MQTRQPTIESQPPRPIGRFFIAGYYLSIARVSGPAPPPPV